MNEVELRKAISARLVVVRRRMGKGAKEAAKDGRIAEQTYYRAEKGETTIKVDALYRLAKAWNISPMEFLPK